MKKYWKIPKEVEKRKQAIETIGKNVSTRRKGEKKRVPKKDDKEKRRRERSFQKECLVNKAMKGKYKRIKEHAKKKEKWKRFFTRS